jgi:hypothetical protein
MKQTAVEWLVRELNQELNYIPIVQWDRIRDIVQRAKAMEKEQIVNAYSMGLSDEGIKSIHTKANAEEFYDETYGKP